MFNADGRIPSLDLVGRNNKTRRGRFAACVLLLSSIFVVSPIVPVDLRSDVPILSQLLPQAEPVEATATCAQGGACVAGDTGPGGGKVFYVHASGTFACGATHASQCKYLEVAPSGWNTGADPLLLWAVAGNQSSDIATITNVDTAANNNNASGIGLGYKNSLAIVNQGNDTTTAAGAARAYAGGAKSDWYLPTAAELNLLCQWARNVTQSVTTACTGGDLNTGTGASGGFSTGYYWSSSELAANRAWLQGFNVGDQDASPNKNGPHFVRPVRAFGLVDTTAPTITSFSSTSQNFHYAQYSQINITATASEAIRSGNTITVTLETGAVDRTVLLTAAAAGTTLTGTYQVQAGDMTDDLTVSGFTIGTVADTAGNAMTSTTVPTGANNIAGAKNLVVDTGPMVITLDTNLGNETRRVFLPIQGADISGTIVVDWGDGSALQEFTSSLGWNFLEHTYATHGAYTVSIRDKPLTDGNWRSMQSNYSGAGKNNEVFTGVTRWGNFRYNSLYNSFHSWTNLRSVPSNISNLVTDFMATFYNATSFNQDLSGWNTSNVTTMNGTFGANWSSSSAFNGNISTWDTSKVTDMSGMFAYARSFNQNISTWNTGRVTTISSMFTGATSFNQNISTWDTSRVTNMNHVFNKATSFNQNISAWNTGSVTTMNSMFYEATSFNQNISAWNTANVTDMHWLFFGAGAFRQNLSTWNTAKAAGEKPCHTTLNCPDVPGVPQKPVAAPTVTALGGRVTVGVAAGVGGTPKIIRVTASPRSPAFPNIDQYCDIYPVSSPIFNGLRSCEIWNLVNGTAYTFTAVAKNESGISTASVASDPVAPVIPIAPGAPLKPTAVAGDAQVTVRVEAGVGGIPVTFLVSATPQVSGVTKTCTVTVPATNCIVTGLTNGTAYTFAATATNATGTSAASVASDAVTPVAPTVAPGAPLKPTAVAGDAQVTVRVFGGTGGIPVTFLVSATPQVGGVTRTCTVTVPANSCAVTGLTNGTAYTFRATATNTVGTSAASVASDSATPVLGAVAPVPTTVPAAPVACGPPPAPPCNVVVLPPGSVIGGPPATCGPPPLPACVVVVPPRNDDDLPVSTSLTGRNMAAVNPNTFRAFNPNQAGAITKDAMAGFNSNQFAALPPTAMGGFKADQMSALPPAAMAGFNASQMRQLSPSAMAGFNKDQFSVLPPAAMSGFDASQIGQLPSTAMGGFNASQMGQLPPTAMTGFKADQMSALPPAAMAGFNKDQFSVLPPAAMAGFNSNQFASLPPAAMAGFNKDQFSELPLTAMGGFKANQMAAMPTSIMSGFKADQMSALPPAAMGGFNKDQFSVLPPAAMTGFNSNQFAALPANAMSGMKLDQFKVLPASAITGMQESQFAALSPQAMIGFKPAQFAALPPDAISGMQQNQFRVIPANAMAAFTPTQMDSMPVGALAVISPSQFKALSPAVIASMSPEQRNALPKQALNPAANAAPVNTGDSAAFATALTGWNVDKVPATAFAGFNSADAAKLSPKVFSSLNPEQFKAMPAAAFTGMKPTQVGALPPDVLATLTSQQLASMPAAALGSLNTEQFSAMPPAAFTGMKPTQVGAMTPTLISNMTPQQVGALPAKAVGGLKADQVEALPAEAIAILKPRQIAELKPKAAAGFSIEKLAAMTPAQQKALKPAFVNALTPEQKAALNK